MLKTTNLSYQYNAENKLQFPDLELEKGSQALLLGESGCGKTTLLHLLSGLLNPTNGSVEINGTALNSLSGAKLDLFRGQQIGIVFQVAHFIQALTVQENLELAQTLSGNPKDPKQIYSVLEELGIGHKLKSKVRALSVGERQRVSIARALINSPALILADEPTSALDDSNCDSVIKLLKEQAQKHNSTLLIVTHDTRLKDQFDKSIEL